MKRIGNLWSSITAIENFQLALKKASKGKKRMKNVKEFYQNEQKNLDWVRSLVVSGNFHTSKYTEKKIYEPKERIIYVLPFSPDRIVQHALMNILQPIFEKMFIMDSYACIPGRGIHSGSTRTMEFVRKYNYVLKGDVRKFYYSVDQTVLMSLIEKRIKCKPTLDLIRKIVFSFPEGNGKNVPIGNYTSQWFGNIYLSELDRYIEFLRNEFGKIGYVRYCDDFLLLSNDKQVLRICQQRITDFLSEKLQLSLSKISVFPVKNGIDFLGYRHFNNFILMRKRTVQRMKRKLKRLPTKFESGKITAEQFRSTVASVDGWLIHANSYRLRQAMGIPALKEMVEVLNEKVC